MGEYIRNLAVSLMGQLGVPSEMDPKYLWANFRGPLAGLLAKMNPETLGRIAACGRGIGESASGTPMCKIHLFPWLDSEASGKMLLTQIAATAIIAEMTDILKYRVKPAQPWGGLI